MKASSWNEKLRRQRHLQRQITTNSPNILNKYVNMTFRRGVTQETMKITDPNPRQVNENTIKVISEINHNQLMVSGDTIHMTEAQFDSEIIHTIVMNTDAHQVSFASETGFYVGIEHIPALAHHYTKCHVSDVIAHNLHSQITKVPHHWNKLRQT